MAETPQNVDSGAMAGLSQKASLPDPREDSTVHDVARLFSGETTEDREMKAFVAGWFSHARNPERLVVEDAWRAHKQRTTPGPTGPEEGR